MPCLYAASDTIRFADDASVELDELVDSRVEGITSKSWRIGLHPFFEGCGGDVLDAVLLGYFQAFDEARGNGVFVGRIHWIATSYHHDDVRLQPEGFDAVDEVVHVTGVYTWKKGDLRTVCRNFRDVSKVVEFGEG